MYARVYHAFADTTPRRDERRRCSISRRASAIRACRSSGRTRTTMPQAHANLPFDKRRAGARRRSARARRTCACSRSSIAPIVDSLHRQGLLRRHAARARAARHSAAAGADGARFCCSRASTSFARGTTRRASDCGPAWRANRRTSSARRCRVSRGWIELLEERANDDVVAGGGRAHARRSRAARSRGASLRAHRPRAEARAARRRGDRRPRRARISRRACRRSRTRSSIESSVAAGPAAGVRRSGAARVGGGGARRRTRSTRSPGAAGAFVSSADAATRRGVRDRASRTTGPAFRASCAARVFEPGLLDEEERVGHRPLAREAHRRGESRRHVSRSRTRSRARRSRLFFTDGHDCSKNA